MHGSIVLIPSSFPSVFEQFIDACDLSCKLLVEMVGFGILKDVFRIEELFVNEGGSEIARTNHEDLRGGKS